jgi:exosortase D (VPLPA-CTERM-specific)
LKVIRLPLILCLAMFPLPNLVHGKISLKLKLISSHLGVKIMQWLGISAYREGNVIDLGVTQLQVVDACNGLRYLIPLIILGLLFAHFFKAHWWKRVALVLSTIPIAVVVNSLRIASVGIFYPMFGARVVEGFFHDFSGWFIFMLTVGLLLVVMWVLRYLPPKQEPGEVSAGDRGGGLKSETSDGQRGQGKKASPDEVMHDEKNGFFWRKLIKPPQFIVACCLLLGTLALSHGIDFREKVQTSTKLDQFPLHLGTWNGIPNSMDQRFIETLDLSDYSIIDFKDASGKEVNLYIAFYESQRKGESIHSPATCLPGGGWLFNQEGKALIPLPPEESQKMPVNRALMKKGDTRQISYFWFPMRGRILTNAYEMKLYNFWDALTRQRSDGALVRLITPIYPGEDVADADKRLVAFTQAIVPVLNEYLPK